MQSNIEIAVITNIIEAPQRTFGFAKLASNGEQAYIGPNIFRANTLKMGDTIHCDIAPNDPRFTDRGCKTRVTFIYDENGPFAHLIPQVTKAPELNLQPVPAPLKVKADYELKIEPKLIYDFLERYLAENPYFFTTSELAETVNAEFPTANWTAQRAGPYFERLHKQEKVAQISILTNPTHAKKSKVAWCHNKHWQMLWSEMMDDE